MLILNLGCGSKTADGCVNIDWSPYLRIKKNVLLRTLAAPLIGKVRRERLAHVSGNVIAHDLRKRLPFPERSVDAVYHSHVLEHIDRDAAAIFLSECKRVLKPDGICRVCVPDWERLAQRYLEHAARCSLDDRLLRSHDEYIEEMIEQCVRRESQGSSKRSPAMRFLENALFGDARKRGETHQWMYDRFNLRYLLERVGFSGIEVRRYNESSIHGWSSIGLEVDGKGEEYKPGSLYVECRNDLQRAA